ncbi:cytoskeleton protein RodZ [Halomonas fontilapidosi]|uniref:Cytoskeleton protein RodZ n=1 Tax=Halomonas fontilapidosi TaxID=616675 RepID=A0A7W5DLM1_9GAMM|nr:RodZ domain-containing protein [Halomonas fontilapidosi]MBB3184830.1 cytoskeleton protein RodZ [Halomonas fontilapidosi]
MSDIHTDDAAETAPRQASPGEMLRHEREAQGLDREEVAAALNLRPAVIQGLENDSYEEVPVPAYRRGYLRSYANLLGIEDGPVLQAYKARFGSQENEHRVTPVQVTRPPSRLGAWLFRLVTVLVIAGLIGLTLMWWQSRGGSQPPSPGDSGPVSVDSLDGSTTITEDGSSNDTALPPLPEEESDLGLVEDAPGDEATGDEAPQPPADSADEPTPGEDESVADDLASSDGEAATEVAPDTAEEAAAETEQTAEAQARDARVLELTFNEQSWTEIFDASNQRIFVGLQEPGTTARVEGEPPFRLTVGNATGVELRWAGESVDLTARAGANNVARFTLGE